MYRLLCCLCCLLFSACPESTPSAVDAASLDVPTVDTVDTGPTPDTGPRVDGGPSASDAGDAGDSGPIRDTGPRDTGGTPIDVGPLPAVEQVDILFVVDNSGSMSEEQGSLQAEIPALINALTRGETPGGVTFDAVTDLRVGVVTTDMGTGGFTIPTCNAPNFGDDGILQRGTDCIAAATPPYLELGEFGPFTADLQCLVTLGTTGCGFEQHLDATLKALTPQGSATEFVNGSRGHADGNNDNFVREGSLLVIVTLTDEDDCSALNPDLYNRDSVTFTDPDLNLRCFRYEGEAVHSIERYIDGLLAVHPPERLLYHVVAGVPVDLAPALGESPDYDALIGEPGVRDVRMENRIDPAIPSQLTPSCAEPGRGRAYPPVRIIGVARGLERRGAGVIVQSICQERFGLAAALSARIALYR